MMKLEQTKKKLCLLLVAFLPLCLNLAGCALLVGAPIGTSVTRGIEMIGRYANGIADTTPKSKEIDNQEIGKYTVRVMKEKHQGESTIFFYAHDTNGKKVRSFGYNKEELKKMDGYLKMNELEKKKFIHKEFLSVLNFNLNPTVTNPISSSPSPEEKTTNAATSKRYSTSTSTPSQNPF